MLENFEKFNFFYHELFTIHSLDNNIFFKTHKVFLDLLALSHTHSIEEIEYKKYYNLNNLSKPRSCCHKINSKGTSCTICSTHNLFSLMVEPILLSEAPFVEKTVDGAILTILLLSSTNFQNPTETSPEGLLLTLGFWIFLMIIK